MTSSRAEQGDGLVLLVRGSGAPLRSHDVVRGGDRGIEVLLAGDILGSWSTLFETAAELFADVTLRAWWRYGGGKGSLNKCCLLARFEKGPRRLRNDAIHAFLYPSRLHHLDFEKLYAHLRLFPTQDLSDQLLSGTNNRCDPHEQLVFPTHRVERVCRLVTATEWKWLGTSPCL